MQSRSITFLTLISLMAFAACKTSKPGQNPVQTPTSRPVATTSAAHVTPQNAWPYRPSETKAFDLIHTTISAKFDWERERMAGEATLTMRPWFAPQQELVLDAKGFLLSKVALVQGDRMTPLKYDYDNQHLRITLDRAYTMAETLQVFVSYLTRTAELDSLVPEEAAGDKGLYFINPRGETPGKPKQIWTQGESHGSPAWFPTFDTPNQRCTDDIYITVADSFKTLSNGLLVEAKRNPDGTRTDHWRMDLPHSPYLFMMAIGNYAVVKDQWRGREVSYYVEPAYAQYAQLVFGNTPEMIEFFSTRLGVDFAWPKYSQVVVRDFVSGAMENTSATTHYGRLQHDAREHLDDPQEDIISHELFHQWFGDLVTCESWANLSLNEGFATYGEYLWIEHKYGANEAIRHLLSDRSGYLRSSARAKFPIIRYHHENADAMFDAHSYAKGGQVLHMLRKQVGDDAFFAALKRYLTDNAFDDVEIHKLRLAFEEVTGQDLNWFFDQWFLAAGHPELALTHGFEKGVYTLRVQQLQDPSTSPIFRIPVTLDLVVGKRHNRVQLWMDNADTTYTIEVSAMPTYVCFDPDHDLLCAIREVIGMSATQWLGQAANGQNYAQKAEAVARLVGKDIGLEGYQVVLDLAQDDDWATRGLALSLLGGLSDAQLAKGCATAKSLLKDPKSAIRRDALEFLEEHLTYLRKAEQVDLRRDICQQLQSMVGDSSYLVSRASLECYFHLDTLGGVQLAEQLMRSQERYLMPAIAKILRESQSPKALGYILDALYDPTAELGMKTSMLRGFGTWLKDRPAADQVRGISALEDLIDHGKERWVRFMALQSLAELPKTDALKQFFQARVEQEKDDFVASAMRRYLAP